MSSPLNARYERMRQVCLKYGNRHPDSKEVCHQALNDLRSLPGICYELALLVDDMYLALNKPQHIEE